MVRACHHQCKSLQLRLTRCPLAQFIGKPLDSSAALSTSFGLTLAGKSLYSRRSGLIFGSEVLKCRLLTGRRAWRGPGIKAYVREYLLDRHSLVDTAHAYRSLGPDTLSPRDLDLAADLNRFCPFKKLALRKPPASPKCSTGFLHLPTNQLGLVTGRTGCVRVQFCR